MTLFGDIAESQSSPHSAVVYATDSPCNTKPHGKAVLVADDIVGQQMDTFFTSLQETPPTKNSGKRTVTELDGIDLGSLEFSPESITKMAKSIPNPPKNKWSYCDPSIPYV